jgi:hypothetical protein
VFCFCFWGPVLLIILGFCVVCFVFVCGRSLLLIILVFCQNTQHRKLKWQATRTLILPTPHKQKQNTQHRKLKWQATWTPTLCCVFCLWGVGMVGVRVPYYFSLLCCVFCFCLWGVCVAYHFSFLCCVFCFSLWRSVFLVILVFCVVCFVKQKQNTQHRRLK